MRLILFHFLLYYVHVYVPVAAAEIVTVGTDLIANVAIIENFLGDGETVGVNESRKPDIFPSL